MNDALKRKEIYLTTFKDWEEKLNGESKLPVHQLRKKAIAVLETLSFPTIKDEEWKYTNINPILQNDFFPAAKKEFKEEISHLNDYIYSREKFATVVFVNGFFADDLSNVDAEDVEIISLNKAFENNHPLVEKYLGKFAKAEENIFTALSTAFLNDGVLIHIKKNSKVEKPIQLIYYTSTENNSFITPRNLFIAGSGSEAKILETYAGKYDSIYFTNSITEVILEENAKLEHIRMQDESLKAFHISTVEVDLERSSNYANYNITFGGEIVRNNFNARFNDVNGECKLNGLYLTNGKQLVDNHTLIDHAKPYCVSHEHYKGILKDFSRGVFNGKVLVRQDAQKTNAFQENNNLLMSENARVDTKPQLEIFADDVKCTHGATIGQLDENSLFYLRSRGLGKEEAKAILVYAFASDVVHSISVEEVRDHLEEMLAEKLLGK